MNTGSFGSVLIDVPKMDDGNAYPCSGSIGNGTPSTRLNTMYMVRLSIEYSTSGPVILMTFVSR